MAKLSGKDSLVGIEISMDQAGADAAATEMSWLEYDPTMFAIDQRYLEGSHDNDLKRMVNYRFKSNAKNLKVLNPKLTRAYMRNKSNVYKYPVDYQGSFDDQSKTDDEIKRRLKVSRMSLERFVNLNGRALAWCYVKKMGSAIVPFFKALGPSRYYVRYDESGEMIKNVYVINGSFLKDGKTLFKFMNWNVSDGKIYQKAMESWEDLGATPPEPLEGDNCGWFDLKKSFKVLPFTEMRLNDSAAPLKSNMVDIENETVAADAYIRYGLVLSAIVKWMVASNSKVGLIDRMVDDFGDLSAMFKSTNSTDVIKAIEQPSTQNQLNYRDYIMDYLKMIAQNDGVDLVGMFPNIPFESGIARRQRFQNVIDVRQEMVSLFAEFEADDWGVINAITGISIPENIIFKPMPSQIDPVEEADLKLKDQNHLSNKFENRTITYEMFVRESNPDLPEEEIQNIISYWDGIVEQADRAIRGALEKAQDRGEGQIEGDEDGNKEVAG